MEVFHAARETYSGPRAARAEVENARKETALARREVWLEREHFLEFRQNVASLMPNVLRPDGVGPNGFAKRELASVVGRQESVALRGTIAKSLFESGKREFASGHYDRANRSFHKIIQDFSYTPYVTESYFLTAEGYYKSGQIEACAQTIRRMIEIFPQSEFTGFAMVRLGGIYRTQNRNDEAIDILTTVMRSYPQRDVAAQAKATLRQLDL